MLKAILFKYLKILVLYIVMCIYFPNFVLQTLTYYLSTFLMEIILVIVGYRCEKRNSRVVYRAFLKC